MFQGFDDVSGVSGTIEVSSHPGDGVGYVTLDFKFGRLTVEFAPRKVRLILYYLEAYAADADRDPLARGWRFPEEAISSLPDPIEEQTLRRYVSEINTTIRELAASMNATCRAPRLLATKRKGGIRIIVPLRVVYPNQGPAR